MGLCAERLLRRLLSQILPNAPASCEHWKRDMATPTQSKNSVRKPVCRNQAWGKVGLLLAALFGVVSLLASAPGCTDSCGELAAVCELCSDASYRGACDHTVNTNNQTLCADNLANYRLFCPPTGAGGGAASSSSGMGSGGGAATSGSGMGGSGMGSGGMGGSSMGGSGMGGGGGTN